MADREKLPQIIDPNEIMAQQELAMLDIHKMSQEIDAMQPKKITSETVRKAAEILRKYKEGKAMLEKKIIANEQFWKLRQWDYHKNTYDKEFNPASAWLWSCIQARHADVMDSFPTCNFLPRQSDDKAEAKKLSAIVPVILEQNKFEDTYCDEAWYMLKQGGGCLGAFWDGKKNNGLGDIAINKIDFLNLTWQPGIVNIQDSENVFKTELVSKKILTERYPQVAGHLNGQTVTVEQYIYDDTVRTDDKSVVVDWYYKTEYNGRKAVHYVKFVEDVVLYATENDTEIPTTTVIDPNTGIPVIKETGEEPVSERGLYDHGLYPFVCQSLYPIEGSLCGYGLTDIGRDTQIEIDVLDKAIVENAVVGASPRYFARKDGSINEAEFLDTSKRIVHVQGNIGEENIRPIDYNPLNSVYVSVKDAKVDELKHITSNQDVNNGSAPSGVTAASALAALQETAGKSARDTNKAFYRMYRDVIYMVVELIRQFYKTPRTFRIAPDVMGEEFVQYTNEGLKPQMQMLNGQENGYRVPEFDIEVTAEKASPYKKIEQNELALNFYQLGFFNPQNADQAVATLTMMDFPRKEEIIQMVQRNGMMYEQLLQYKQMALGLAQKVDPSLANDMAQMILQEGDQPIPSENPGNLVDLDANNESAVTEKARSQARATTEVE